MVHKHTNTVSDLKSVSWPLGVLHIALRLVLSLGNQLTLQLPKDKDPDAGPLFSLIVVLLKRASWKQTGGQERKEEREEGRKERGRGTRRGK